jgi:hypothetical protein
MNQAIRMAINRLALSRVRKQRGPQTEAGRGALALVASVLETELASAVAGVTMRPASSRAMAWFMREDGGKVSVI